jgi:transposase
MAGKPKAMRQIKQLILLHQQKNSIKAIARTLQISRNTVKEYLYKLINLNVPLDSLLQLEDHELERKLLPGNPAYTTDQYCWLKNKLQYYIKELKRTGVTKRLLWEEYRSEQPNGYQYAQFCYHLSQHVKSAKPSMILHHQPADKLYVDFAGKKVYYVDLKTGEQIACELFVACMPYSDYGFVMAVPSQRVDDFLYCIKKCLHFLGGVPGAIVPDNLKSAVTNANRYEPTIQASLEQLANHYGCTVVPARAGKPKDKALVENHVKLAYQRLLAPLRNQIFHSLNDLNKALEIRNLRLNQTRMQQKGQSRESIFMAAEKPLLKPLPTHPFELYYHQVVTVQKNNHVYLTEDKHYYSVPHTHIGLKAKLVYSRSLVHIIIKGEKVAVHRRNKTSFGYSTEKDHLCSYHQQYLDRSPAYYLRRAAAVSPTLVTLFTRMFESRKYPEVLYKSCDGILKLQSRYEPDEFDFACKILLEHGVYSYKLISDMLINKASINTAKSQDKDLPKHDNIRGKNYYH